MNWIIEPKAPLVFGDGRSIGNIGGVRSLNLPWSSTLAGMVRTLSGSDDEGKFDISKENITRVKKISVKGPFIVSLETNKYYFPAPKDIVWNQSEKRHDGKEVILEEYETTQLVCQKIDDIVAGGLTDDDFSSEQQIVAPNRELPAGKVSYGPLFWKEDAFFEWLETPQNKKEIPPEWGLSGLLHEERTHVAIDYSLQKAKDGDLFSTDGVVFQIATKEISKSQGEKKNLPITTIERLGIGFQCEEKDLEKWKNKSCFIGGERRLAHLRSISEAISLPSSLKAKLLQQNCWRVVLLTNAIFVEGAAPATIFAKKVVASVVGRPLHISGWDYELRGPKPSRRMVGAGSVFWIDVSDMNDEQKSEFLEKNWNNSCSTKEQDQRDGFGIAVFGVEK